MTAKREESTLPVQEEKRRMIEAAMLQLERQFGKGVIMRLGQKEAVARVQVIPTGLLSLDAALGIGGFPRGRIVEIFGPEMSGKTTLALHMIAQAQKDGGVAVFIDAEHALDPEYAAKLGVRVDDLIISQPDYGEQALEIAETLIRSGGVDIVVIDSVAALVPKAELEGEMGDQHVGLQARLMSQALRKLTSIVNRSQTCLIFINQIREKIGPMTYGVAETTPGGRALKFYASLRIDIRKVASIKQGEENVGARTRIRVVKNKLSPPFKQADVDLMFGEGLSREGDLIDLGLEHKLVVRSGAWFSLGDIKLGQGREAAKQFLKENLEVAQKLETQLREKLGLAGTAPAGAG